jgi:hypothetical protein
MAFSSLHFYSPALVKACSMSVIVPEIGVGEAALSCLLSPARPLR